MTRQLPKFACAGCNGTGVVMRRPGGLPGGPGPADVCAACVASAEIEWRCNRGYASMYPVLGGPQHGGGVIYGCRPNDGEPT